MFDNIIGHQNLIEQFRSDIGGGTLPRVLLFHGDPYSGKLTAALEMARVLTCTGGSGNSAGASGAGAIKGGLRGEWGCGCRSCSAQRLLLHQSTLILGIRPFMEEITATAEILKRHRKQFAQFLFLRSVRKLTRRFDPLLWEGQETRLKKSLSALEAVEEDLELIAPGKELPADSILEERLNRIVKNCADIISGFGSDNIPVNQIRRVSFWSHTTTPGENKVVIIEGAEKMQEGSRNALLKILEEPPENCYFILLTTNRGGVIPTILSRARGYQFPERKPEESADVLRRIFKEESGSYRSIREYFLAWNTADVAAVRTHAIRFLQSALAEREGTQRGRDAEPDSGPASGRGVDKGYAGLFFFELNEILKGILRGEEAGFGSVPLGFVENCLEGIREASTRIDLFNQSPALALETLAYRIGRDR